MTIREKILNELGSYNSGLGGSCGGYVYQDYPWPPLREVPARFETTAKKLALLMRALPSWEGLKVLDVGCANGAVSIGLALMGAKVVGVDASEVETRIAQIAAHRMSVRPEFIVGDPFYPGEYDVIVCFSVWKWLVWSEGRKQADYMLQNHMARCRYYIFESGISDAGTDLGAKIRRTEIPFLLAKCSNGSCSDLEMLGSVIDPKHSIRREFWKVW